MPARLDLTVWQGDTYAMPPITIRSDSTAIDVSSWSFSAKIATGYSTTATTTFSVATGSASSGIITLSLTSTQTAALTLTSSYVWDLQRTLSGDVKTLIAGKVRVKGQVTT